ncbi:hypothetical protein D9M71_488240 [compost metagenome]
MGCKAAPCNPQGHTLFPTPPSCYCTPIKAQRLWIGCRLDTSPPAVTQPGLELSRSRDGERKPRIRAVRYAQVPSHIHPFRLGQPASAQGRHLAGHGFRYLRHPQPLHLQGVEPDYHAQFPAVRHQRAERAADGRHRPVRPVRRRADFQLRLDRTLGGVQRGPQLGGVQPAPGSPLA